jgi:hypothetical protein
LELLLLGIGLNFLRNFKDKYCSTTYWLFIIILSTLAGCYRQQTPNTGDSLDSRYFQETGYTVQGEFLYFFEIYGGADSLGYPLTGDIRVDGWKVQYFEKGRLEYHPENEPAYRITVGWLGDLLNRRQPPIPAANIPRADKLDYRYYAQTGHIISGDFLRYFDTHGGSVRFGLPISEPFLLEGQLTQDFQSARFFWTPRAKEPVALEEIGRIHLEKIRSQNKKLGTP